MKALKTLHMGLFPHRPLEPGLRGQYWAGHNRSEGSTLMNDAKGNLAILARQGNFLLLTSEHQDRIRSAQVIRTGSSSLRTRPDPAGGLRVATL